MADVAVAVRTWLLSQSTITDVVGQRIYADQMPQTATLPSIELSVTSDVAEMQLSDITGLTKARLQFNCIAATRAIARSIAKAIRTSGIAAIKGQYTDVWIRGVAVDSTYDVVIEATDGSDDHRYQSVVDLLVDYLEV